MTKDEREGIEMFAKVRNSMKKVLCVGLAVTLVLTASTGVTAKGKAKNNSKALCGTVIKKTGNSDKLKYTSENAMDFAALSFADRKKVKNICYVCDDKEVYSVCVMIAKDNAGVKKLYAALKKYKKNNNTGDYLSDYSDSEKKVFKNSIYGKQGKYVWYIAMSSDKAKNNAGQKALKKAM